MFTSGYVNTETILHFFNTTTAECYPLILAQREEGRLNNEIRRINNEIKDLTEKRNIIEVRKLFTVYFFFCFACQWLFHMSNLWTFVHQNNIFKNTQRLEDLKSQMNWDQKALEAWLEESARKDEDALTLQKYTRSDEGKVKVRNHYTLSISTTTAI